MENKVGYLKYFKPITSTLRHTCLLNKSMLWIGKPVRRLSINLNRYRAGRNSKGSIIMYTKCSRRYKRLYRIINYKYHNFCIPSIVYRIEYDPNRSSFIVLNFFFNGTWCYFLQTANLRIGDTISSYFFNPIDLVFKNGDSFLLRAIPEGSSVHSIEKDIYSGSLYSRSAGSYSILIRKFKFINKCVLKLKSGIFKILSLNIKATLGIVCNFWYRAVKLGKAGRSRWLGIKPNVRGVAMNPIDHPHGGGEGKKSKSVSPRTSWGKIFKWKKTSNYNKLTSSSNLF